MSSIALSPGPRPDALTLLDPAGARFGPYAIRGGSRRQISARGYNMVLKTNPYESGAKIVLRGRRAAAEPPQACQPH
jgi:arginase family enzyme